MAALERNSQCVCVCVGSLKHMQEREKGRKEEGRQTGKKKGGEERRKKRTNNRRNEGRWKRK